MIYCINPDCNNRQNPENLEFCQACRTPLLVRDKYRLLHPLRPLDLERSTEIFEVAVGEERRVIKILKRNSPKLVELFDQEAFTLESLDHPGIPKTDLDGYFKLHLKTGRILHCFVMEKVEGENLEQWLEEHGRISQKVARDWLKQLIKTLDYIHAKGFFHRDIKPSNIMLKPDGQLVIIDFGTARAIDDVYLITFRGGSQPKITRIVSSGYTAPEQINGKATPQSDLFALGRTFVHLLTGIPPSELPTDSKTGNLIWQKKASQVSKLFADLIDDLMAPLPRDRPKDSDAVLKSLENLRLRSIERFVSSPRFRIVSLWIVSLGILLGITGFATYKFVIAPLEAKTYSEQGREALNADDFHKARQNLERAVKLAPNDPLHRNDLGLACELQKEFECAEQQYKRALEYTIDSDLSATIQYNLGVLYEERREFARAIERYEIAMTYQGQIGIDATNRYVRLLIWQKHESQLAIQLCEDALRYAKDADSKAVLYKNLGWAYFQQNRYSEANKFLTEAIRLDRNAEVESAAPYCLLAKLNEVNQNSKMALNFWKSCRKLNPYDLPEVETWQSEAERHLSFTENRDEF